MGRTPCCSKVGLHRGLWTPNEDILLTNYVHVHGEGGWKSLPMKAGLLRCGKSCRLRWMNYLRPDIKRGNITPDEDDLIIRLHSLLGNRWSLIAGRLSGRTDNEIKNYWKTHLSKKLKNQETRENRIKNDQESTQMTKIYVPKPIRIKPFSIRRLCGEKFDVCNGRNGDDEEEDNVRLNNIYDELLKVLVCEDQIS